MPQFDATPLWESLWRPGETVSLARQRERFRGKRFLVEGNDWKHLIEYASAEGADVWHSVNPINPDAPFNEKAANADVTRIAALYADLDDKDGDPYDALHKLEAVVGKPNWIVQSGHGLHVYWLTDSHEAWEDMPRALPLLRSWKTFLALSGADTQASDPSRILRVPGTFNHKSEPVEVVLIEGASERLAWTDALERIVLKEPKGSKDHEVDLTPPEGVCEYGTKALKAAPRISATKNRHGQVMAVLVNLAAHRVAHCIDDDQLELAIAKISKTIMQIRGDDDPGEVERVAEWAQTLVESFTAEQITTEIGHEHSRRKRRKTGAWLKEQKFDPRIWYVPEVVREGLGILAGDPKAGKSFFALDMLLALATGGTFLGMPLQRQHVFYVALESDDQEIQERSEMLLRKVANIPASLEFVAEPLSVEEASEEIMDFYAEHPHGFVVVDTVGQILPNVDADGPYQKDRATMTYFRKMVQGLKRGLLLVHHSNKGGSGSSWLSRVSGTQAMAGGADYIIFLEREDSEEVGVMHTTGRGAKSASYDVEMVDGRWVPANGELSKSIAGTKSLNQSSQAILGALRASPGAVSQAGISEATALSKGQVSKMCKKLETDGLIYKDGRGWRPVTITMAGEQVL